VSTKANPPSAEESGGLRAAPQVPGIRPTRRRSLPEEIVDQLLELITSGSLPEQRLPPERELCKQLEVSRASLREALSALNHLGVVETRGKAKYGRIARARAELVARLGSGGAEQELVTDPLEVRRMLEPEVAAGAAQRGTEQALDEIEHWLHLMEEAAERGERVVEYDSAFHVSIARATGNHTLVQLIGALTEALRESRELSFEPYDAVQTALAGHRAIVEALRAHDPNKARRAMRRHLDEVERLIRASLTQAGRE
jgi:GntR family transcriptional repressor for pyruvate dehydrogenase complex